MHLVVKVRAGLLKIVHDLHETNFIWPSLFGLCTAVLEFTKTWLIFVLHSGTDGLHLVRVIDATFRVSRLPRDGAGCHRLDTGFKNVSSTP